jgi:hypothetical protein
MDSADSDLLPVSLEPTPAIEAYKKDVDRTLLRENLTARDGRARREDDLGPSVRRGGAAVSRQA